MKYHIDTIPVWDALDEDGECLLCILEEKLERSSVDFYLGDSVMSPDMRIECNKKGFCPTHYEMLFNRGVKLPLALMCYTRMEHMRDVLDKKFDKILKSEKPLKKEEYQELVKLLDNNQDNCLICERLKTGVERYCHTVIHMWKKESEFKSRFLKSKGLCLNHYSRLTQYAMKDLSSKRQLEFAKDLALLQRDNLDRISKDVKWFADKFDHKNISKPWGASKDALPRTINKLSGRAPNRKK